MSDILRMQLDIQNNLEKDLEKSTKKMKGFNSLIEDASDKFMNMGKSITKYVGGALRTVGKIISTIIPGFAALFSIATIMDAVRGVLEMNKELTQLSYRMGHGAQGVRVLKQTVFEVNAELGIGIDKAQELVTHLTEMRVPLEMMREMTRTTGLFVELTGLSADRVAELAGNLVIMGQMGQESVDGIMASMVGVQRAVGLTTSEMNSLTDTIVGSTQMLNQMGKTAGDIEKYNRGVVKLAAAFASVGVEAGKVLAIMDDLLDPSEVEKHAFLLSQLGVSLGDAFEGNIDPENLVSGFRDLGKTLQGMTGPAAAAMAEQLGMSVRDLRQMGTLGDKELANVANAMADGASGAEAMAAAFHGEATGLQRFERTMEKIKGFIGETADKFMPVIEKLFSWVADNAEKFMGYITQAIEWFMKLPNLVKLAIPLLIMGVMMFLRLIRRRFATTATEVGKSLETGVAEGIEQGGRKGRLAMQKDFASSKAIDLRVRTEKGREFSSMMGDAELLEARAGSMSGIFGNVMKRTADIHRNLAYSTKPVSIIGEKIKSMGISAAQNLEIAKNERGIVEGAFQTRERAFKLEREALTAREEYLNKQSRIRDLTGEEAYQLNIIEQQRNRIDQNIEKENKRRTDFLAFNTREQSRFIKRLSDEQLVNIGIEEEARRASAQNEKTRLLERQTIEQNRMSMLEDALKEVEKQWNFGEISAAERVRLQDELNEKIRLQQETGSALNAQLFEQNNILSEVEEKTRKISDEAAKRGLGFVEGAKQIEGTVSIFGKVADIARTAGRNLTTSVTGAVDRFTTGAVQAAGAFADRFRKENIGATLRGAGRGVRRGAQAVGRGAAGALGGIGKMLGPIGLLVGILSRLEPVQKMMGDVMEKIRQPLQRLAEMIMPIIQGLMNKLMPIIEALVGHLMSLADGLIKALVPIITRLVAALGPLLKTIVEALGPVLESVFAALVPLIDMLLPPLIWVLGALVEITGILISAIGNLIKFMMELPERFIHALPRPLGGKGGIGTFEASEEIRNNVFYKLGENISEMGKELSAAGKTMRQTAFDPLDPDTKSAFTESIAEGTAEGAARSEIRRTWEPAQIRAMRDGISQEKAMTEVLSGSSSSEDQVAANTERMIEQRERQHQEEMERMRLEIEESNRRHEEVMAANAELRRAIQGGSSFGTTGSF